MIMVLSDGGKFTAEVEKQLNLHNDKYVFFFSDVIAASRFGKGNVIIGKPSKREMARVFSENKIDGVIDATEKPVSKLSQAALSACNDKIKYVKLVKCGKYEGAETIFSYKDIADRIKRCKDNTLIYGTGAVTKGIAKLTEGNENKIFVTVKKSPVFDVEKALEYSIPIFNVKEYDAFSKADEMKKAIDTLSVGQVVFIEEEISEDMIEVGKQMGVKLILTHSMGIDYPVCVNNMRDALIEIHNKR